MASGTFVEGEASGTFTEWTQSESGPVKTSEGTFTHGLPDGTFRTYFVSGLLASQSEYESGTPCGTWKRLDESGAVIDQKDLSACDQIVQVDEPPPDLPDSPEFASPRTTDFGWNGQACRAGEELVRSGDNQRVRFCVRSDRREGNFGEFILSRHGERKIVEGHYAGGLPTGVWRSWYGNTLVESSGAYDAGLRTAEWRKYSADGWLLEVTNYAAGLRHGLEKLYHHGGRIGSDRTWNKGSLSGHARSWSANGDPESEGNYSANQREGLWKIYGRQDGLLVRRQGQIVRGRNEGPWTGTYEASGNREAEFSYVHELIEGPFRRWHDNGQEAESGRYLLGNRTGEWLFHYADGQLAIRANYAAGFLSGEYESYYSDGSPKAKGTVGGNWTSWDSNGIPTSCFQPLYLVCP